MAQPFPQDAGVKWKEQVEDWLTEMGAVGHLRELKPWSQLSPELRGLSKTARVRAILDCVAIEVLGGAKAASAICQRKNSELLIRATMDDCYVDVSQNPVRKAYCNSDGLLTCLRTGSSIYSFR